MATELRETSCCAVYEIENLSHSQAPEVAMKAIANRVRDWEPSMIMFTGVTFRRREDHASNRPDNYGEAFTAFIRKNKLGKVRYVGSVKNPHTKNDVGMWVWTIDRKKFEQQFPYVRQTFGKDYLVSYR